MVNEKEMYKVAEVDLVYQCKVLASDRPKVSGSKDAFEVFKQFFDPAWIDHHEEFKMIVLNRSNRVLGKKDISMGGNTGTVVDVRIVMQTALMFTRRIIKDTLKGNGVSIILCHNHPSGNLSPSEADISITRKVKEAAALFDIAVLDHLIITSDGGFYSFADEGVM
jgi:DNA repair protein RadC